MVRRAARSSAPVVAVLPPGQSLPVVSFGLVVAALAHEQHAIVVVSDDVGGVACERGAELPFGVRLAARAAGLAGIQETYDMARAARTEIAPEEAP